MQYIKTSCKPKRSTDQLYLNIYPRCTFDDTCGSKKITELNFINFQHKLSSVVWSYQEIPVDEMRTHMSFTYCVRILNKHYG